MSPGAAVRLRGVRLTLTTFVTLDGVYQSPGAPTEDPSGGFEHGGWLVPLFDDDLGRFMVSVFEHAEGFVLGRKTYDIFAGYWPRSSDPDDPIASKLNTLPKYVASRTLSKAEWRNSTVLAGDVVADVANLKEQPGRELQIHGSGLLAQTLLDAGVVDTVRLVVFPVVLGSGKRLLADGRTPWAFRLVDVESTPAGVIMQTFELAGKPTYGSVEDS
jgi:dihydrofolate reductase